MNRARPTGLDSTASAVPVRISRATDDEEQSTAPNRPVTSVTASVLVLTIWMSSPKPKYGTTERKTQKKPEQAINNR